MIDPQALLTKEQARQDYPLLRLEIAKALTPGPWEHKTLNHEDRCSKCGKIVVRYREYYHENVSYESLEWSDDTPCPIPDPATGPLEVLVRQMVRKIVASDRLPELEDAILEMPKRDGFVDLYREFVLMDPAEQAVCCLLALGQARVEEGI